jgi:hypothetical protein
MKKIPVVRTIKAAYRFTFQNLGAIIGLIWLPMVLKTVIGFFVLQRYYEAAADALASNNYARLGPSMLSLFCYFVAAILFYAVMYVPVTQMALGQRKDATLLHFALGPLEWRMFRALAGLVSFLMLPVLIAGFLISMLTSSALLPHGLPAALAADGLETLAYLGIVYLLLRFVFFIPALAAGEEGPVLPRAWMFSAGNFWRILGIVLATVGPVAIAAELAELVVQGPEGLMPSFTGSTAMAAAQLHRISQNMPLDQGIAFLVGPLILGLSAGSSAAALTALKEPSVILEA